MNHTALLTKYPNTQANIQAVVLTGARQMELPILAGTGVENKVLLPLLKKPMLLYVLEALSGSKLCQKVWVSTNDPVMTTLDGPVSFETIPIGTSAVGSFLGALSHVDASAEWVLFVSGDHALLTPEMLHHFVDECIARQLALGVAVVDKAVVQRHYPESRRTYFHAKGGAYSGGNLFLVHLKHFQANPEILEMIDQNRKQPWKSLKVMHPWLLLRYLFRQVDIHETAQHASRFIGCHTGIVEMPFAECCMDVDKPSDKMLAEQILARRHPEQELTCYTGQYAS